MSTSNLYMWGESGGRGGSGGGDERRRRRDESLVSEGPSSSSRQRWNQIEVWPEPFVEALAHRVATDAARTLGPLAAAPALSNVFQVCSTWQSISRSDHLWQRLTRDIWGGDRLLQESWRDEYMVRHGTASNFRHGRAVHRTLQFQVEEEEEVENHTCLRLALSGLYLACGLVDGSVRVFDLTSNLHIATFHPQQRDRLGLFSGAVSGVLLSDDEDNHSKLVFASLDGDIHVAVIIHDHGGGGGGGDAQPRRVQMGNVVNDGTLVDFSGCRRWWVGLYAGVPGRSFHVWDAVSEQLVFVGGSLTDPEAVMGWHLLTELNESIGRVRLIMSGGNGGVVACTGVRVMSLDLQNQGGNEVWMVVSNEVDESQRGVIVDTVDVSSSSSSSNRNEGSMVMMMVDRRRVGRVCRLPNMEQVCRFRIRGGQRGRVLGCISAGCVFVWSGGGIRTWDARQGLFLYQLDHIITGGGEATALIADDRHLVVAASDTTIHLWNFVTSI